MEYSDPGHELDMQHYDGDVTDLSLDFTVTEESLGKRKVIELKPGGKDICVTNENKLQYIHAIADYKLNRQVLAGFVNYAEVCFLLSDDFTLFYHRISDTSFLKCILWRPE